MTPVRVTVHRTFHSLGHSPNFRRFFIGQAISVTGTWMQMVAAAERWRPGGTEIVW